MSFCPSCVKCPQCCVRSGYRGQTTEVLANLAQVGSKSQGGLDFARGIHATLQNQTTFVKDPGYSERLCSPHKKQGLSKLSVRTARQIGGRESASQILPGILQPSLSGTKAQQSLEAYPRPQPTKSFPASGHVQDGNPRNNQTVPPKRRMGNLAGFQRRLLSHTNQSTVPQVPPVLPREEGLSVHSSTFRASYCPARVYKSSQGGEIDGTGTGYPDPPVPRRLVSQGPLPPDLPVTYPDPLGPVPRFSVAGKHDQIGAYATTGVQFRRLPVRPPVRSGSAHSRQMGLPTTETSSNQESQDLFGQTIHVTHRTSYCHRETSVGGAAPHEAHSVASEKTLARSREFRENYPNSSVTPSAFRLVAKRGKRSPGSALTSPPTRPTDIYRRLKRRLGRTLRGLHSKRHLVSARKSASHKFLGAKSCTVGAQKFRAPLQKSD